LPVLQQDQTHVSRLEWKQEHLNFFTWSISMSCPRNRGRGDDYLNWLRPALPLPQKEEWHFPFGSQEQIPRLRRGHNAHSHAAFSHEENTNFRH
jgi:hypothetical protein